MKDKRSSHTVDTDRWDRSDYARVRREIVQVGAAIESLAEITPTASPEIFDTFMLFMKSRPEFLDEKRIRDDHRIDLAVNIQAEELPEMRDLRRFTRGDLVGAAMATVGIEGDLKTLFDREKFRQRQAEELQKLRDELMEKMMAGASQGDLDSLRQAIADAEAALGAGLGEDQASMAAQLARALGDATDEARAEQEAARAFGVEPGRLVRMPAKERLELAKLLNSKRLRQIAQLFGPLRNLAFAARQRTIPTLPHEMTGVTIGRDLERLLPSELLKMCDPDQEDQFFVDLCEGRLQCYKMQGKEKVGKGGIVALLDSSGSMSGKKEMYSKAIMLVLMNIAKKEGRTFHVICFGSPGVSQTFSFVRPADFTLERILEVTEFFLNSGTDFATPFRAGLDILKAEFARTGKVESDILCLSDGECSVTDKWLEEFHADLEAIKGTAWGILVGTDGYSPKVLQKICNGLVCSVADLANSKDIKSIFGGIRRA